MTDSVIIAPSVFNTDRTYGEDENIFLGQQKGLFDTVHKKYPRLWKLYKEQKDMEWDENEFDYSECNAEFKKLPKSITEAMITTLAFQWETDSFATHTIVPVISNLLTSSEAFAGYGAIGNNETTHAATYSEIVRQSFDDPSVVTKEVLKLEATLNRLSTVAKVMNEIYVTSHKYALGLVKNDQETYNMAYLFPVAMFCLERIQFMASFAVTFGICENNHFMPIGSAVQKICKDELEVHVEFNRAVFEYEMETKRGQVAHKQILPIIQQLVDEVIAAEFQFVEYLFSGGRELLGLTPERMKQFVLFNAADVYTTLKLKPTHGLVTSNPLKFLENGWMKISNMQSSPQEEQTGDYLLNVMVRDDQNKVFNVDF